MRAVTVKLALVFLLTPALLAAAPVRANITMDDGDVITVDSMAHSWPQGAQIDLIKKADRSTRSLNVSAPVSGLMKAGDRVFITYKYLAWFGKGTLQGVWTLSGDQGAGGAAFKYPKVGAWAHNELIVGSSPQTALTYWDRYAPPTEMSIQFGSVSACCVGVSHQDTYSAPNRSPYTIYDGLEIPEGIFYANGARMSGEWVNGPFVDTFDGNDNNGVQAWIDSQAGFICNPDYIRVIWRFIPRVALPPLPVFGAYYWLWVGYSKDYDNLLSWDGQYACDAFPSTDEWPASWYDEPRYFQSNLTSVTDATGPHPGAPYGANLPANTTSSQLPRGLPCGPSGTNPGIYTGVNLGSLTPPAHGDWVKFSASSTFTAAPTMKVTFVQDSAWGTPLGANYMVFANEARADAVWGSGAGQNNVTLQLGDPNVVSHWRTMSFQIATQ